MSDTESEHSPDDSDDHQYEGLEDVLAYVNNRSTDSLLMGLRVACFSCTNTMCRTKIASEWENSTANTLATEYLRLDSSGRWTLPNLWPHGRSWVHHLGWWLAGICRAILIHTKVRTGHATPHKSRKNAKHVTQLLVAGEISSYLVMHTKMWNWFAIIKSLGICGNGRVNSD